jgi:hypothetical protein
VRGCFTSFCLAEFVGTGSRVSVTFYFLISCIVFCAGAEFFLRWVPTNGFGTVSSLGFALFNFSWIHKLVLRWVVFFPSSHAVRGCFTSCCLAEFVCTVSYFGITFNFIIDFFAGREIFLCLVSTNGSGAISSLVFALFNFSWIHKLVLRWVVFLPSLHAVRGCFTK